MANPKTHFQLAEEELSTAADHHEKWQNSKLNDYPEGAARNLRAEDVALARAAVHASLALAERDML